MVDRPMTKDESQYVLGTDEAELVRLGFQHRVWAKNAFDLWERAGFAPGQTILDVGCGPGFAALDLASIVGPEGRIIAVDESQRFLDYLREQLGVRHVTNVKTVHRDVQGLRQSEDSVDGAFARWVLCFVKDPEAVVSGVARALRRGGTFAVMDYYNYLAFRMAPRSEIFEKVIQAVVRGWMQHGGDPEIGARIPAIMISHGLSIREICSVSRVARPGTTLWQWPATFFRNFLPRLVTEGILTPEEKDAFDRVWEERSADPAAFLVTPPMVEIIGVKS